LSRPTLALSRLYLSTGPVDTAFRLKVSTMQGPDFGPDVSILLRRSRRRDTRDEKDSYVVLYVKRALNPILWLKLQTHHLVLSDTAPHHITSHGIVFNAATYTLYDSSYCLTEANTCLKIVIALFLGNLNKFVLVQYKPSCLSLPTLIYGVRSSWQMQVHRVP
jgi:hypothetical protein